MRTLLTQYHVKYKRYHGLLTIDDDEMSGHVTDSEDKGYCLIFSTIEDIDEMIAVLQDLKDIANNQT